MEYVLNQKRYVIPDSYIYEQTDEFGMSTKEACEKFIQASYLGKHKTIAPGENVANTLLTVLRDTVHDTLPDADIVPVGKTGFSVTYENDVYEVKVSKKRV